MRQVLRVIDELDTRAIEVAEHLPQTDMSVVVAFLEEMARVVDHDEDETATERSA